MARRKKSTKIAKRSAAPAVVKPTRDVEEVREQVNELADQMNTIAPPAFLSNVPTDCMLAVKILQFEEDDFYWPSGASGFAPHKRALVRIASAIGIQWEYCRRVDQVGDPFYAEFEAAAWMPDPGTGELRRHVATYALDVRDGSQLHKKLVVDQTDKGKIEKGKKQLGMKRQHIVALADSGARLRLIREATGMKTTFSKAEIKRPFAIVSLVHRPGSDGQDTGDVALGAGLAARMLYGAQANGSAVGNVPRELGNTPKQVDEHSGEFPAELTATLDEVEMDDWPTLEGFSALSREEQIDVCQYAIQVTGYDFAAAMADQDQFDELVELPSAWLVKLYETLYRDLDPAPAKQWTDDDIPFS